MIGYLVLVHTLCYKNYEDRGTDPDPPELWVPIGYYNGDTLYEQTYANGKTAWCFKDRDIVVIQRVTNESDARTDARTCNLGPKDARDARDARARARAARACKGPKDAKAKK